MISPDQNSNPFPGLRPFEPHQSELFFGRDEQIEELLDQLESRRFLAVVGTSGSGKSSLVRAGMIPAIERGYLGGSIADWRIAIFRPGSGPRQELAQALAKLFGSSDEAEVLATISRSSLGLVEFARNHLGEGENLLLVVDQFEELFRYRRESDGTEHAEDSSAFVKLMLAATGHSELPLPPGSELPIYVVLTMRSDFLGQCARFRGLPEALNNSQYLVPRMTRDQQREGIEGPIGMSGARITAQLVQRLLNDVGDDSDQLPVLQHALMRTWEQSRETRESGDPIDISHYGSSGAMKEALDRDVEWVYNTFPDPADQTLVRRIFQRLVEPSAKNEETRRPTPLSELAAVTDAGEEKVREVLRPFLLAGFLTISQDDDPIVDVTHESLIRLWKRLRGWVGEETTSARIYSRLADSAQNKYKDYGGLVLQQALDWKARESPNAAWAARYPPRDPNAFAAAMIFLDQSARAERRREVAKRRRLILLVAGLVVASTLAVLAVVFAIKAERQKRLALAQKVGAVADSLANGPARHTQRGLLFAVAALDLSKESENFFAYKALNRALGQSPVFVSGMKHAKAVTALRFSPDGKHVLSGSDDMTARIWDVATGKEIDKKTEPYPIQNVFASPDGRFLATTSGSFERFSPKEQPETPGLMRLWQWNGGQFGPLLSERQMTHPVSEAAFDETGSNFIGSDQSEILSLNTKDLTFGEPIKVEGGKVITGETAKYIAVGTGRAIEIFDGASMSSIRTVMPIAGDHNDTDAGPFAPEQISGNILVAFTRAPGIYFFDLATGKSTWRNLLAGVNTIAISPNGRLAAAVDGYQGTYTVWDLTSGKEIWRGGTNERKLQLGVVAIRFSPDGSFLAFHAGDDTVRVFSTSRGTELFRIGVNNHVSRFAFSPDSGSIAVGEEDGFISIWRLESGREVRTDTSPAQFSPQGKYVEHASESEIAISDSDDGHSILTIPNVRKNADRHTHTGNSSIFSLDDRYYAFTDNNDKIRAYDISQDRALPLLDPKGTVISLAFDIGGKLLVATGDGVVSKWNVETGEQLGHFQTGKVSSDRAVFSPKGDRCAITINNSQIELWDTVNQTKLGLIPTSYSGSAKFSPDGKLLAVITGELDILTVWSADTGKEVWRTKAYAVIAQVNFDTGGKTLAAALGSDLRIYSLETGGELTSLQRDSSIGAFAFSPDNKFLAAAYTDGSACLWDIANRLAVIQFSISPFDIESGSNIQFSPRGEFLIVQDSRAWPKSLESSADPENFDQGVGQGETIHRTMWLHQPDLIHEACRRVARNYTKEEWFQYFPQEEYRKPCPNLP